MSNLLRENVHGLLVLAGWLLAGGGLWLWSASAALVGGGVFLILLGVWPYLTRVRR